MSPFDLMSPMRWAQVGIVVLIAGLVGAAFIEQRGQILTLRVQLAQEKQGRSDDAAKSAIAARELIANYRAEEQRRAAAQQEKIDAAEKIAQQARADRAIADAAAGRLQQRVADLIAAARQAASNPAPVQPRPAADDAPGMLADVLGRCIQRVRLLATVADERGTAGKLCEQSYDALTEDTGFELRGRLGSSRVQIAPASTTP